MTNRDLSVLAGDQKRLALAHGNFTGGRIANVADRAGAMQTIEARLIENFRDVTHVTFRKKLLAVRSDDAARFLAAMLQCVQAEIGHARRFRVSVDAEHTTLFA